MKLLIIGITFISIVLMPGCAGREPNPIATHQIGDDNRTCELLKLEVSQNEALITKKLKEDEDKFWTNFAWFLTLTPAMDLKEAEKTEAEALRARNDYLKILMSEKGCK
jgi:hypothetical protein